jgi:hypothetical protein
MKKSLPKSIINTEDNEEEIAKEYYKTQRKTNKHGE